jgi:hypothetical protein
LDDCHSDLHIHPRGEQQYAGLFLAILQLYILVLKRIQTVTPSGNNGLPPPWNPFITRLEHLAEQRSMLTGRVRAASEQHQQWEAERNVVATTSIARGGSAVPRSMISKQTYSQMKGALTHPSPAASQTRCDDDDDDDEGSIFNEDGVPNLDFTVAAAASSEPPAKRPKAESKLDSDAAIRHGMLTIYLRSVMLI